MLQRDPNNEEEIPIKIFSVDPEKETILWLDDVEAVLLMNGKLVLVVLDENQWREISFEELLKDVIRNRWLGSYP